MIEYILGGIFAFLVGLFLYYGSSSQKNDIKKNKVVTAKENEFLDGEFKSKEETDVIIVGAGVAGAALAYTLGKILVEMV